ncbi:MAG TPA: GerMN domain-containing protein [Acidimicrobiia bacterium]
MFILLIGLYGAGALAGCGVPADSSPRALPPDVVPADLLAVDPITTTSTVPVGTSTRVRIYLVGGGGTAERLVPVERSVQSPATVERVLSALTSGPNREEAGRGLRSAILPGTIVNSVLVESNIAIVDLVKSAIAAGPTDLILAIAQMVYSATELQGVGGVRFTLDGERANIPTGSGIQSAAPVGRAAYAAYAPL